MPRRCTLEKTFILRLEIYQPANKLPSILKKPITAKDQPETVGAKPQIAITPGMWVITNAT